MKEANNNTVYILSTLSVYIGLVLVGGSPHIIASTAEAPENFQTQSIRKNSQNVVSKTKFKSNFKSNTVLPFAGFGNSPILENKKSVFLVNQNSSIRLNIDFFENNQAFTISKLPRAHLKTYLWS